MACGYSAVTGADVSCTTTAATKLAIINGSAAVVTLTEFGISFDGVTAGNEPVLIELCLSTEAGAGTSTDLAPVQIYGPTRTAACDAKKDYTSTQPTVLTAVKEWLVHPQAGLVIKEPLGRELQQITASDAIHLRVTAPNTVNCRAYMCWEEA